MNVFLIESPFQVMNALEAVHHFNYRNNHLIILLSGLFSRESYEKVIDRDRWEDVRFVPFRYRLTDRDFGTNRPTNLYERLLELSLTFDQTLKKLRLNRLCQRLGPVDALVLGSYRANYDLHMRHIANRINHQSLCLLDVGTDTLVIARQRAEENQAATSHPHGPPAAAGRGLQGIKTWLRRLLVEWDAAGVAQLTFFTSYDLKVTGQDRLEKNRYDYFKSLAVNCATSDSAWFIGQPLVEQQYLSLDTYRTYLEKVKSHFAGKEVWYIPHPRESIQYVELAANEFGFKIRRFDVPIEYAVTRENQRPSCIASFFSSALDNCDAMFGGCIEIKAFHLRDQDLLKYWETVGAIYDYYTTKSRNIELVY